jgi:hypothetical protein
MKTKKHFNLILLALMIIGINANGQESRLIAEDGVLYSVDNEYGENKIFFYSNAYKKADLKLDAGKHTFVFSDWKSAYQFTIDMKPNVTYLVKKGKPLTIKEGKEKLENISIDRVSVNKQKGIYSLTTESDKSKTATLIFKELDGNLNYRLRRVDNFWAASRLGFHNGMDGSFTIILSPGKHQLVAEAIYKKGQTSNKIYETRKISIVDFNFEAGKNYTIVLDSSGKDVKIVEIN